MSYMRSILSDGSPKRKNARHLIAGYILIPVFLTLCAFCSARSLYPGDKGRWHQHFNLVAGIGSGRTIMNPGTNMLNRHFVLGVGYEMSASRQVMIFCPILSYRFNGYVIRPVPGSRFHTNQHCVTGALDVLARLTKRLYLRMGLELQQVLTTSIYVSFTSFNSNRYLNGHPESELEKQYSGRQLQGGIRGGLTIQAGSKSREIKFTVLGTLGVTPLVNRNFYVDKLVDTPSTDVLSYKARPIMLMLLMEMDLTKSVKTKPAATEEEE